MSDIDSMARDVRAGYIAWCRGEVPKEQAVADFDRFIARVKAEAAAGALRSAAEDTRGQAPGEPWAGATYSAYAEGLTERANQIEKEQGDE